MFSLNKCLLFSVILLIYSSKTCTGDIPSPSLTLYMPGEPEWTEVLVRRVNDNLTLVCELKGDNTKRRYVWNFVAENSTNDRPFKVTPSGPTNSSTLFKDQLQEWDSGHYMCSAPPFSVTKFILVQDRGPKICGRGTFWCGQRCMAAQYVCDGRLDCLNGEDEAAPMCSQNVCGRADKLNCSSGRCISSSACCRRPGPLCQQPSCCEEYPMFSRLEASYVEEYPPLFEDRHAPDDYGFIQSTIYTVTACALIFMLAVVLLVSAICKMHMKRAALRSYAHAERATRQHYTMQYEQTHRFPPSYDAFRLLEAESRPPASPVRETPLQCNSECPAETPESPNDCASPGTDPRNAGFGLARLSAIFSSRYRQVPTQSDVELTNVRSSSLNNSPTRNRTLDNYRSPTYCDLNTSEFYFTNPETADLGRDLNYMAPVDLMRNRNNSIERVIDQFDRQRLTLQLGRFQLTIPRFGRRNDTDRRPDTPNVAEINIDDLDFVRMTSHETYTLNGRTIRLLGANFENYPLSPNGTRPPPYNEAMRCKFFGPPPEYLSREGLNSRADEEARTNVEMPPCYDELNGENPVASSSRNGQVTTVTFPSNNNGITVTNSNNGTTSGVITVTSSIAGITDRSTSVTSNNNGLEPITVTSNSNGLTGAVADTSNNNNDVTDRTLSGTSNNNGNVNNNVIAPVITVTDIDDSNSNNNVQSLSSIINNLPAIDSDVNANDTAINC